MRTFQIGYFFTAVALFAIEVLIAMFFHGGFVRFNFGDYLVVILIYCTVRTFFNVSVLKAACGVLVFSYVVEITQYFHLIHHLGLESSTLANLILGNQFEWKDLLAYTCGIGTVWIVEISGMSAKPARRRTGP